jgi:subtilisin family serine protease
MKRSTFSFSFSLSTSLLSAALALTAGGCATAEDEVASAEEASTTEHLVAAQPQAQLQAQAPSPSGLLRTPRAIPGQYIVVLRKAELAARSERAADVTAALAKQVGATVVQSYQHALSGFAAKMSEADARALLADPRVAYIAEDGVVEASATQGGATWGLDRIDQKERLINGNYSYHTTGAGVHAYIIDTGIRLTHAEFTGRIGNGFDAVTAGGNASDCNGHGTHVAGTVGGSTYGVAKGVTLHPVRVLDCGGSGSFAGVIAGVDWVTANHVKPAVANMSLGGGVFQAVDDAVTSSIAAGVTYAIAAGNSNADACNSSPARTPNALTVGATDASDNRASFSNFGTCTDLFAPGSGITSSYLTSDTATAVLSGTSMAAPHVAGVAALYLQRAPSASPAQVAARLTSAALPGVVANPGAGSPNRLLHNGLHNLSLRAISGHYLVAEGSGGSFLGADRTAVGNWERFDVADLNGGSLANNDVISLRVSNGSYLVAEGGGGGVVNADRPIAAGWEQLRVINLDGPGDPVSGNRVALQASSGQFVVAENGGGLTGSGAVNANRAAVGPWETFVVTFY